MRKEILIAIIAGLVIGIVIAYGSWRINSVVSDNKDASSDKPLEIVQTAKENELEKETHNATLSFDNIDNLQVITQSPFIVSGKTRPNSAVAISSESEDFVVSSSSDGTFQTEIPFDSGINQIITSVFDADGNNIAEEKFILVYSDKLPTTSSSTQEIAADKSNEPSQTSLKPKALLGAVTDKTENSLQVRNLDGKIELVSVDPETSFERDGKEASFDDVAIGDYLAILGFANGSTVHEAKNIVLTSPVSDPTRKIVAGKLSDLSSRKISLVDASGQEITISLPRRWKGPNVRDLEEDLMAVVVFDEKNDERTLRTIQVVEITNLSS